MFNHDECKSLIEKLEFLANTIQSEGIKTKTAMDLVAVSKRILRNLKIMEWNHCLEAENVTSFTALAMKNVLRDIDEYKSSLELINSPEVAVEDKLEAALFIKCFNKSLEVLKRDVKEDEFFVFYNHYFRNKTFLELSFIVNVDGSRKTKDILESLARIEYPDLMLRDIFYY